MKFISIRFQMWKSITRKHFAKVWIFSCLSMTKIIKALDLLSLDSAS